MTQENDSIDLDYESPLEGLFWFLGSPWCMGLIFLVTWFSMVSYGKNGRPPFWPDFPVAKFFLIMLTVWAVGYWLKASYDVRYVLNSRSQQLELVRTIFGRAYRFRIADFAQLHSTAVLSTWSEDKQSNRYWEYALALITQSGRIVRVSSYSALIPSNRAAEIAQKLGIAYFQFQPKAGTLKVRRAKSAELNIYYNPAPRTTKERLGFLNKDISLGGCFIGTIAVSAVFYLFGLYLRST
ncbi:hypothetical protein JST97_09650 [bacterium]|nr:hypothetical protein [bacterium]